MTVRPGHRVTRLSGVDRMKVLDAPRLRARLYLTGTCPPSGAHCGAIVPAEPLFDCEEPAAVCVHVQVGPTPRIQGRSALCEQHAIQARTTAPPWLIERMHTIPAGR